MKNAPDLHFADPLEVVESDDLDYEFRLGILQAWLSRVAGGQAVRGTREELEGAILALQARSKLKVDMPKEQPQTTTYGGVERSDLRSYSLMRLLRPLIDFLRR